MNGPGGPETFGGTSRFQVVRRLGAGAMGVVYEAWDHERSATVALKTLHSVDGWGIYQLKREFRALADVAHPNLVALHELFCEGERWFFTMELVPGVGFLEHVRPGHSALEEPTPELGAGGPSDGGHPLQSGSEGALDEARLRDALRQLALGISALHEAGQLHRDLKPSNIRIRPDGRLLILDFGLAKKWEPGRADQSTEQMLVGTPAYMAPEQAAMESVGPPADWYAFGAVLYEALTGRAPFSGSAMQILMDKQVRLPSSPFKLAAGTPEDLSRLCMELLKQRPEERPPASHVLALLGARTRPSAPAGTASTGQPLPLVGREALLGELRACFDEVRRGKVVAALLHGPGGVGTTALAHRFAESVRVESGAVVLIGRCDERESVPFKALDNVVDALGRFLVRLPREQAEALLPRDVRVLARMFPVLLRVEAISAAPARQLEIPDAQESRRRAALALRELLARIADRHPLVLVVDGLQWSDPDSAALAAEVLRPSDAPSMLLIGCYREPGSGGEQAHTLPLAELLAKLSASCVTRDLRVEPLEVEESRELSRLLLLRAGLPDVHADALARESGGSPFFIHEMVRALQLLGNVPGHFTLSRALTARVAQLPAEARALLELVALSEGPLRPEAAFIAANLEGDAQALLSLLRAGHLIRTSADGARVEAYHERIAQAVSDMLGAKARRARHARLAAALESSRHPQDAAALAFHLEASGQPWRAAEYAALAAADAASSLAFERAARLYRQALSLRTPDAQWGSHLESALGEALVNAGHGAQAANVYFGASQRPWVPQPETRELRRRAAEQYLRSGHIDEGVEALSQVLTEYGLKMAKTPRRALASLVFREARLMLRGTRFKARDMSQLSALEVSRIDACWSGAVGLGMVDIIRGNDIQAHHLQLALAAGEPMRVARALVAQAPFVATPGGPRADRAAQRLISQARELAAQVCSPQLNGLIGLITALVDFLAGRWRSSHENADVAAKLLQEKCTGVAWELANSQLCSLWSLFYLGELGELSRRVDVLLREALNRGDLYAAASLRTGLTNVAFLVRDDVPGARREVHDALQKWSQRGFHFQHYWGLLAQGITDLYAGDGAQAHQRMEREWPQLKGSLLLRIHNVKVEVTHLRARAALAAAVRPNGSADERLLKAAQRDARTLERARAPWAKAQAQLIRAGVALHRGDSAEALLGFERAARLLDGVDQALYAAAARRRVGQLRGGDEGAALSEAADKRMRAEGIVNPERMAALLAP